MPDIDIRLFSKRKQEWENYAIDNDSLVAMAIASGVLPRIEALERRLPPCGADQSFNIEFGTAAEAVLEILRQNQHGSLETTAADIATKLGQRPELFETATHAELRQKLADAQRLQQAAEKTTSAISHAVDADIKTIGELQDRLEQTADKLHAAETDRERLRKELETVRAQVEAAIKRVEPA